MQGGTSVEDYSHLLGFQHEEEPVFGGATNDGAGRNAGRRRNHRKTYAPAFTKD